MTTKSINVASRIPAIVMLLGSAMVTGCATTQTSVPQSRIEIEDAVGFTITEEARIGGNVRVDYEEALSLLEQGRHSEGIAALERLAEEAPLLSAPWIDLGIAHHLAGDLVAAEKSLQQALELSPDHPIVHNELGIIYRKSGRFAEARESYEAALAVYPGYHFARRNLAVLCDLYLADLRCALENYEAYMATVPADEEASIWIADIRNRMGQ
jgi:Flp pilus assembly protein TadD